RKRPGFSPQQHVIRAGTGVIRGDLDGGLTQPPGLGRQRMAVELGGRDRQIAEVRTRSRVMFVVIIEGSLHDDRLERRPKRRSCQGSSRRCYTEFLDRERGGIPESCRDPHRGVRRLELPVVKELADPLDGRLPLHAHNVPRTCGTERACRTPLSRYGAYCRGCKVHWTGPGCIRIHRFQASAVFYPNLYPEIRHSEAATLYLLVAGKSGSITTE